MSELDNFGTAGAKSADRAIEHSSRAMLTDIILTKIFGRAIGRCLFNPGTRPGRDR
ncbi:MULTISPECIES: hypothetical protein [unclassified Microcoleus]|uniref:hypothetical protein n=1 Tax=unclassified Microcoleus TaxID=2642155 RepID=UPI002FD43EBF